MLLFLFEVFEVEEEKTNEWQHVKVETGVKDSFVSEVVVLTCYCITYKLIPEKPAQIAELE